MATVKCVCCSGKAFEACCEPLLEGKTRAKTVRQLMRSRYAAYALGQYGEYLIKSWHPASAKNLNVVDLSMPQYNWLGLEVIEYEQKGDFGKVEFKATFQDGDGPKEVHHERSIFHRLDGVWLYVEGEVNNEI